MKKDTFSEVEDIVHENTILIKKNRALVSINHDNLHGIYRESYDVTRELLLLQMDRMTKYLKEEYADDALYFEFIKKRVDINKKTSEITQKIIESNNLMAEAVDKSRTVNLELIKHLIELLNKTADFKKKAKKNKQVPYKVSDKDIQKLVSIQKENIVSIFKNNAKIKQNRKRIQDKISSFEEVSDQAQALVEKFHELIYG